MNLQALRTKLRRLIGNPTTTSVTDVRLNEIINQAHRDIGIRYRFHNTRKIATFPLVSATKRYTLPADLSVLMKVWDQTNQQRILKRTAVDLASVDAQNTTSTGNPLTYFREQNWIEFEPIPSAVATIVLYYRTTIADMVADADVPLLPLPWHNGLCFYSRWIYYDEEGFADKAQYAYNTWTLWVSTQPNEIDEEGFADFEQGVRVPQLGEWRFPGPRLRWDEQN